MPRPKDIVGPGILDAGWNSFDTVDLEQPAIDWSASWDEESSDWTPLKTARAEIGTRSDIASTLTTASAIAEMTRIDWNAGSDGPRGNAWANIASLFLENAALASPP